MSFLKIQWTRDSVCMADDCNAPNTKIEEMDHPPTVSNLLDRAADYVPGISGAVWVVWVEDTLAGYLELSTSGYLLRDEAVLKELPPPKPHRGFFKRKPDILHVHCVLYTMSDFSCRKGRDGRPLIEHFPPYTPLLDMVKAQLREQAGHGAETL